MRGIVLAGGLGTRLRPLTFVTNKHLLPIYDKPMIYYPLETLLRAGIKDVMVVTGANFAGDFLRVLGNGHELGFDSLTYAYQEGEGGIADALRLCEDFSDGGRVTVLLGDNILQENIGPYVRAFLEQPSGARVLLKEVPDPSRFGVPTIERDRIINIAEKPAKPDSNYAVIGAYMYDSRVFDICRSLRPSSRGELEITDVNNAYIATGELFYDVIRGWWVDAGTFDSLLVAGNLVSQERAREKA